MLHSRSVIGPRVRVPVVCSSPECLGAGQRCQGRNVDTGRCCTASQPCEVSTQGLYIMIVSNLSMMVSKLILMVSNLITVSSVLQSVTSL